MPRPRAWPPAPAGRCLESSRRRPRAVLTIFCGDTHACQVTAASFSDRKCTLTSDRLRRRCQSSPVSCTRDLLISGDARTLAFPSLTTAASALYFQLDGGGAQSAESGCGATLSAERVPAKVRNPPKAGFDPINNHTNRCATDETPPPSVPLPQAPQKPAPWHSASGPSGRRPRTRTHWQPHIEARL